MFTNVWGHVLTDNIRRLWFLKSDFFQHEFKNCPIVYCCTGSEIGESFKRFFEILGVDIDKLERINQPTKFDKVILPDESFFIDGYESFKRYTNEYLEMINHVKAFALKNRTPTSAKKIYYFYGRKQIGEERLAEYFKSKGYEIILPENLPLDEQLNLLINCESFASTLGSCAHNSLFLRNGTEAIFIPRFVNYLGGYQQAIDQINSLNVNYIDSTMSVLARAGKNYCYIISEQLKRFFGDKWNGYEEEDFKIFLQYVKNSASSYLPADSYIMKLYNKIFPDFMAQLNQREDLISAYDMPPRWEKFQPPLTYQTHVNVKGWGTWQNENQISNPLDQKFDIQAIKINFPNHKVYCSVYFNEQEGWSEEVSSPEMAGTTGKNKPIYGIRIRLDEAGQKEFDILYRMHKFDGEWTDWAKNGKAIYSHGVKLNAIQIKLESKRT